MMVDPGEWIPLVALLIMAGSMVVGVTGAWAVGRARGLKDAMKEQRQDADTHARMERMERSLESVAEEIERLGEVQRFALKLIGERAMAPAEPATPALGRVITPH